MARSNYNNKIIKALHDGFKVREGKTPTNCALIFAYNGTGKTRLSWDFAHSSRKKDQAPHTLYYNAYTEDLFTWDNDSENDGANVHLNIDTRSSLIQGLKGSDIITPLVNYLSVFTDVEPTLLYEGDDAEMFSGVKFTRTIYTPVIDSETGEKIIDSETGKAVLQPQQSGNIKISRGEERLFVWCFFRCILDHVIGGDSSYSNIRYIFIDDPMSSLDDNNVIAFASQLYDVIRQAQEKVMADFRKDPFEAGKEGDYVKFIISSHHALFFHTMSHGLSGDKSLRQYYLNRDRQTNAIVLKSLDSSTPFYYNVAMMYELQQAIYVKDKLYTYHFTILRGILERIRDFFGQPDFKLIFEGMEYYETKLTGDRLTDFVSRTLNVLTHQASMFQPTLLNDDNKKLIKAIFDWLMYKYKFGIPDLADYRSEKTIKAAKDKA